MDIELLPVRKVKWPSFPFLPPRLTWIIPFVKDASPFALAVPSGRARAAPSPLDPIFGIALYQTRIYKEFRLFVGIKLIASVDAIETNEFIVATFWEIFVRIARTVCCDAILFFARLAVITVRIVGDVVTASVYDGQLEGDANEQSHGKKHCPRHCRHCHDLICWESECGECGVDVDYFLYYTSYPGAYRKINTMQRNEMVRQSLFV